MEEQKHSGLGIASFITSIISGIFIFLTIAICGVMELSTPGGVVENSPVAIMAGLLLLAFLGVSLVALGLGIGGLVQKERKKEFAILGTVFAALILVSAILLMIIASMS